MSNADKIALSCECASTTILAVIKRPGQEKHQAFAHDDIQHEQDDWDGNQEPNRNEHHQPSTKPQIRAQQGLPDIARAQVQLAERVHSAQR